MCSARRVLHILPEYVAQGQNAACSQPHTFTASTSRNTVVTFEFFGLRNVRRQDRSLYLFTHGDQCPPQIFEVGQLGAASALSSFSLFTSMVMAYLIEHLRTTSAPPRAVVEEVRGIRLPLPQQLLLEERVDRCDHLGGVHLARGLLDREG